MSNVEDQYRLEDRDYSLLSAYGPTGLTEKQTRQLEISARYIAAAAFTRGMKHQSASKVWRDVAQRGSKEPTNE